MIDYTFVILTMCSDAKALSRLVSADSTGDATVLEEVACWYQYCKQYHQREELGPNTILPGRLIDLMPDGEKNCERWRLVELPSATRTGSKAYGYTTLSHRWGHDDLEPFKLTSENKERMLRGLPDNLLSGTFQDAMRVTRLLKLRLHLDRFDV